MCVCVCVCLIDGKFILELARSKDGEKGGWVSVPRKPFQRTTLGGGGVGGGVGISAVTGTAATTSSVITPSSVSTSATASPLAASSPTAHHHQVTIIGGTTNNTYPKNECSNSLSCK